MAKTPSTRRSSPAKAAKKKPASKRATPKRAEASRKSASPLKAVLQRRHDRLVRTHSKTLEQLATLDLTVRDQVKRIEALESSCSDWKGKYKEAAVMLDHPDRPTHVRMREAVIILRAQNDALKAEVHSLKMKLL